MRIAAIVCAALALASCQVHGGVGVGGSVFAPLPRFDFDQISDNAVCLDCELSHHQCCGARVTTRVSAVH